MPIQSKDIQRGGWHLVDGQIPFYKVLQQEDIPDHHYIIVAFPGERYAVVRKSTLLDTVERLRESGQADYVLAAPLQTVVAPLIAEPVYIGEDLDQAREKAKNTPGGMAVVLKDGGEIAGLLPGSVSRGLGLPSDQVVSSLVGPMMAYSIPKMAAEPPEEAAEVSGAEAPSEEEPILVAKRYINVQVRDHENNLYDAQTRPLELEQTYNLAFDVDLEARTTSLANVVLQDQTVFEVGEEQVELTVRLASDDFRLDPEEGVLRLPRSGKSLGEISFSIQPLHEGPGVISALFLKDNNLIQVITLKFFTGSLFQAQSAGRPVEAAFSLPRRDINLTLLNTGTGFQMIMTGAVAATATLPLNSVQLAYMVGQIRTALSQVVNYISDGEYVYQEHIDIPVPVNQQACFLLAKAGFRLYQNIFFGPSADEQVKKMGTRLRDLFHEDALNIQVFAREFTLPWGILYLSEKSPQSAAEVDPELFLGLKHEIENIPLQLNLQVLDSEIDARSGLSVGLNVNTDIDQQIGTPIVAEQLKRWEQIQQGEQAKVAIRRTGEEVRQALVQAASTPDQVMYFNCHAVSYSLLDGQGPDESTLLMTGDQRLTLGDLYRDASPQDPLPGNPLVFINACQSAELSPLFYDGFVPYFMAKGARGVIGTECDTPAIFAKAWAERFFDEFLKGDSLGGIVLNLRREFYYQHNNILGLLYAIYVDGNTRINR